jgi:hypothetical protein
VDDKGITPLAPRTPDLLKQPRQFRKHPPVQNKRVNQKIFINKLFTFLGFNLELDYE